MLFSASKIWIFPAFHIIFNRTKDFEKQRSSCFTIFWLCVALPFHSQPDPPGRVCRWACAPSECFPVWRLSGRCCDSWSCARSCLRDKWLPCISIKIAKQPADYSENMMGSYLWLLHVCSICLHQLFPWLPLGCRQISQCSPLKGKQSMRWDDRPNKHVFLDIWHEFGLTLTYGTLFLSSWTDKLVFETVDEEKLGLFTRQHSFWGCTTAHVYNVY